MLKTRLACIVGSLWLLAGLTPLSAQTRSFQVRGRTVQLQVDPNLILVKTSGQTYGDVANVPPRPLALSALRAQAELTGADPGALQARVESLPPRVVVPVGGVLVPRAPGLTGVQVRSVAARLGANARSSEVVFKLNDRTVLLKGTLTVRFKAPPTDQVINAIKAQFEIEELERPKFASNVVRFQPKGPEADDPFTISDQLSQREEVRWAEADLVYELMQCGSMTPNDHFFDKQWYLKSGASGINAMEAWGVSVGTDAVTVAVLDDGVDLEHAELKPKLVAGFDYYESDDTPQPQASDSHGTACAGIIGAVTNNKTGTAGIAWNCKIMPLRIAGGDFASDDDIAKAFEFARANGAKVISCSWGGGPPSNKIVDAIDQASDAGCLIVAASGNALPAADVFFPASYERCMAVGAVRQSNKRWNYSCWGPGNEVDLVAPSGNVNLQGDIWTTDQTGATGYNPGGTTPGEEDTTGDTTARFGGTSAATPIVAGVAALIWSDRPSLTADQVRIALESTATKVDEVGGAYVDGRSKYYGTGKVDALAALQKARSLATAALPPPPDPSSRVAGSSSPARSDPPHAAGGGPASSDLTPAAREIAAPPQTGPDRAGASGHEGEAVLQRRLTHALEPSPANYEVRGANVRLNPNLEWVAVELEEVPRAGDKKLASAVKPSALESVTKQSTVASKDRGRVISLVPRSALRAPEELIAAARQGDLPALSPVYDSEGSLLVPLGTVTVRLKSPEEEPKLLKFAESLGLRKIESSKGQVRLELTNRAKFGTTCEVARALMKSGLVRWSEPDFARNIEKFKQDRK